MSFPLTDVEGVAVRRSASDAAHTNAATLTPYVLNDDGLAERCTHFFSEYAPNGICRPASRKWHDQSDWPRRIGLRPCNARHDGQHRGARGQTQKLPSGKIRVPHDAALPDWLGPQITSAPQWLREPDKRP